MNSLNVRSVFQAAKHVLLDASRIPFYFGGLVALAVLWIKFSEHFSTPGLPQITSIIAAILAVVAVFGGLAASFSGLMAAGIDRASSGKKGLTIEIKTSDGKILAQGLDPADVKKIILALTQGTKHGS